MCWSNRTFKKKTAMVCSHAGKHVVDDASGIYARKRPLVRHACYLV